MTIFQPGWIYVLLCTRFYQQLKHDHVLSDCRGSYETTFATLLLPDQVILEAVDIQNQV